MAKVVCIHGISQEYEAQEVLEEKWTPALCGGVRNAGGKIDRTDVAMCFYGGLFRPQVQTMKNIAAAEDRIENDFEREILLSLAEASEPPVGANKALAVGRPIQALLQVVARSPFFGNCAQQVVIRWLKQVWWYVNNDHQVRELAQQCLLKSIGDNTRVLVAHSLGSIIAYEVLCANPALPVRTLITLGSPLGIPALGPRLRPPITQPPGQWPGGLTAWFNIADQTDIVALEKQLSKVFGDHVQDHPVHNGVRMHDVTPYLTAPETGRAVLASL